MQSSGGSITTRIAGEEPVRTVLSGPAGGVVGAFHVASEAGYTNIITLDMGGTSTDVSLCPGEIKKTSSSNIGGYPIGVPMIEIHTVGAGGGSIANMDVGGALTVGPQSAGADPGPACYGIGDDVTVTDANLLLGRLQAGQFLGGQITLDVKRAEQTLTNLARLLQTNAQSAATGILRIVNSHMERAIRSISLERGYDPREFTLVPFGGAGPLHSCELAEELGITRVLSPRFPGILSAFGVAIADIIKDYSRTIMAKGSGLDALLLIEEFTGMESLAKQELANEGLSEQDMIFQRFLDVRYIGQSFELTIDCPNLYSTKNLSGTIANTFQKVHQRRFGYADKNEPIEIVNLRLKLQIDVEKPVHIPNQYSSESPDDALISSQLVYFREGPVDTKLFDRELLKTGNTIQGPALIVQMDSTTLIPPHWIGTVDPYSNLVMEFNQ
jgi:N-methylhydantoinase A